MRYQIIEHKPKAGKIQLIVISEHESYEELCKSIKVGQSFRAVK